MVRFFAVLSLFLLFFCGGAFAAQPSSSSSPAPAPAGPVWVPFDGPAAGNRFFGYAWPFEGRDIQSEIGTAPVLVELFSDPGCMYCGPADHFLNDLVTKTRVIAFSCHVNALKMVNDDPLVVPACGDRQMFYSVLYREPRLTPQIFVNGRQGVRGYLFQDILARLTDRSGPSPRVLDIRPDSHGGKGGYVTALPAMAFGQIEDFDDRAHVKLVEYRKPVRTKISTGPNAGREMEYLHVVSRIIPLADWFGKDEVYHFKWAPSAEAEGAVLLFERQDTGLIAFGEIRR